MTGEVTNFMVGLLADHGLGLTSQPHAVLRDHDSLERFLFLIRSPR